MKIPGTEENLIKSVILGLVIGDGTLKNGEKTEGANPLLAVCHGNVHLPLALETARILGRVINTTLTSYPRSNRRIQHEVQTARHSILKEMRGLTYVLKDKSPTRVLIWEKVLPKNFERILN